MTCAEGWAACRVQAATVDSVSREVLELRQEIESADAMRDAVMQRAKESAEQLKHVSCPLCPASTVYA